MMKIQLVKVLHLISLYMMRPIGLYIICLIIWSILAPMQAYNIGIAPVSPIMYLGLVWKGDDSEIEIETFDFIHASDTPRPRLPCCEKTSSTHPTTAAPLYKTHPWPRALTVSHHFQRKNILIRILISIQMGGQIGPESLILISIYNNRNWPNLNTDIPHNTWTIGVSIWHFLDMGTPGMAERR